MKSKYPEAIVGALVFNNGKIFLAKGGKKFKNLWLIPGGHIELGEKIEDAIKREFKEETNLDVYDIKVIHVDESVFTSDHDGKHYVFINAICKAKNPEDVKIDNRELVDYKWVTLKDSLNLNINSSTKRFIKKCLELNY